MENKFKKYVNLETGKKLTYLTAIGLVPGSIFILAVYLSLKKIKEQHKDFNNHYHSDISFQKWLLKEGGSKQIVNTLKTDLSSTIQNSRNKVSKSIKTFHKKIKKN